MYSKGIKKTGMLSVDTKKPAKSINGMINTGVSVTASYLSENEAEIISE